jgi:hypothetical protein
MNFIEINSKYKEKYIKYKTKYYELKKKYYNKYEKIPWDLQLNKLKEYIKKHGVLPTCSDNDSDISNLAYWFINQKQFYDNKTEIMTDKIKYYNFQKFLENYKNILSENHNNISKNCELYKDWNKQFNKIEAFVSTHKRLPSHHGTYGIELYKWLLDQQISYNNKTKLMSNTEIYNLFGNFLRKNNI